MLVSGSVLLLSSIFFPNTFILGVVDSLWVFAEREATKLFFEHIFSGSKIQTSSFLEMRNFFGTLFHSEVGSYHFQLLSTDDFQVPAVSQTLRT